MHDISLANLSRVLLHRTEHFFAAGFDALALDQDAESIGTMGELETKGKSDA